MRILVLSDSHGNDMMWAFDHFVPEWEVVELCVGRLTAEVRKSYLENIVYMFEYAPDVIYLHTGHNDISYHPIHNTNPHQPLDCFKESLDFLDLLREKHPYSFLFYSSLFPRALGPSFGEERKIAYNRMAAHYQSLVADVCEIEGRRCCLNSCLWEDVRSGSEKPELYNSGGLHLNTKGKRAVVRDWVRAAVEAEDGQV
jgi:lysophospholipase L1-like esterase